MAGNVQLERQALALFQDIAELPLAEQPTAVTTACRGNRALEQRVNDLLRQDQTSAAALEQVELPEFPSEAPPQRVGPYALEDRIGVGGMGDVYRARRADGSFERTVAIKFIRSSWLNPNALERFNSERQIMAQLQHPHITALLDGGMIDNRPYLVMEYVEGNSLRFDPDVPRKTQLQRLVKVCRALHHAHSRLVLHRDVKPDNILIDAQGEPHLLDFGIAKLMQTIADDSAALTAVGVAPMTPNYTAPECINGESATVLSDIYSLGVLMFELVGGRRPYDLASQTLEQMYATVSGGALPTLNSGTRDLDQIVATAMHRDPERRYQSAEALAEDIERFLQQRPILARKDDSFYILRRLMGRHKALSAFITGSVALIIGALITTAIALNDSEQQRLVAEQQKGAVVQSVSFIASILHGANPLTAEPVRDVDELLVHAEQAFADSDSMTNEVRAFIAANLGSIYSSRGDQQRAAIHVGQAQQIINQEPGLGLALETLELLAGAQLEARDYAESVDTIEAGLQRLREAPEAPPLTTAKFLNFNAAARLGLGEHQNAKGHFEQVLDLYRTNGETIAEEAVTAYNGISSIEYNLANFEAALLASDALIEILSKYDRLQSNIGLLARGNRVSIMEALERFDEADREWESALTDISAAFGEHHVRVIELTTNYGMAMHRRGDPARAVAIMEPLEQHVRSDFERDHQIAIYFNAKLGYAMCASDRVAEGLALLERSYDSSLRVYGPTSWHTPDAQGAVGYCQTRAGNYEAAEQSLQASITAFEKIYGPEHPGTRSPKAWLAEMEALRDAQR